MDYTKRPQELLLDADKDLRKWCIEKAMEVSQTYTAGTDFKTASGGIVERADAYYKFVVAGYPIPDRTYQA